jgi:hypothetical protein
MRRSILYAAIAVLASTVIQAEPAKSKVIAIGMNLTDVSMVFSGVGLSGEDRLYAIEQKPDLATKYFPIDDTVAVEVVYSRETSKVTHVSLMTSPSYRPVKGLEVHIPLLSLTLEDDGSYTARIARLNAKKDVSTSTNK